MGTAEGRKALHSRLLELRAVNEDLQMMTRENQVANGKPFIHQPTGVALLVSAY